MLKITGIVCAVAMALTVSIGWAAAEEKEKPLDDATAKKVFEENYEAGANAATEKKWDVAQKKLTEAIKALGEHPHAKKSTATVLLSKAQKALYKDDALTTALELKRLKQWAEAEEAYRLVISVTGETESIKKDIIECRTNLESENPGLKTASDLFRAKKWQDAIDAYNKAAETLGTLRPIREGLNDAKVNIQAEGLLKKAGESLQKREWEDAFAALQEVKKMLGETDEVKKGIAAAQTGYQEDLKKEKK